MDSSERPNLSPTPLLRIPGDIASSPGSKLLVAGDLCFGEYHQTVRQKPRNVFVTQHTLIFVAKGSKVFRFPDKELVIESGKALLLKRGCYMLCEALASDHAYESVSVFFNESALRGFWLSLDADSAALNHNTNQPIDSPDLVVLEMSPAMANFRDTIINCFSYEGRFLEALMKVKLQELLLLLLEASHADELLRFFGDLYGGSLPDPLFTVEQNLFTPLSISDYAQLSSRSLSKFKRDFREATGKAPGKWIQTKRLDHARLLASSTRLSVGEICAQCGFNNLSHFIRSYKAAYGVTPASQRQT
ncbi:MAG: helix-turn-helix domain-containing protein [Opitutales bacterium]